MRYVNNINQYGHLANRFVTLVFNISINSINVVAAITVVPAITVVTIVNVVSAKNCQIEERLKMFLPKQSLCLYHFSGFRRLNTEKIALK
jgi:hypothetical protein